MDAPSWCNASLLNSEFHFPVTGTESSKNTDLSVRVNEYAPADLEFCVTIKASVDTLRGPFGILPFINGCDQNIGILFAAAYTPLISVEPEYSIIETRPGTIVIDPITIKNLGNGKTRVHNAIKHIPDGWGAIISPSTGLEVNESKIPNLTIKSPVDFYRFETIILSFTPEYNHSGDLKGPSTYVTISVNVRV